MTASMRKLLVFLALGIFAFDLTADSICLGEQPGAGGDCCACACVRDTHLLMPALTVVVSEVQPVRVVSYEPSFYAFHQAAAIFHPPCLAA